MAVIRCSHCQLPFMEKEVSQGLCPSCGVPLAGSSTEGHTGSEKKSREPGKGWIGRVGFFVGGLMAMAGAWMIVSCFRELPPRVEDFPEHQALLAEQRRAEDTLRALRVEFQKAKTETQEAEKKRAAAEKTFRDSQGQVILAQERIAETEKKLDQAVANLRVAQEHGADLEKTLAEIRKPEVKVGPALVGPEKDPPRITKEWMWFTSMIPRKITLFHRWITGPR